MREIPAELLIGPGRVFFATSADLGDARCLLIETVRVCNGFDGQLGVFSLVLLSIAAVWSEFRR
jgi:hypothetical protein